MLEYTGMRHTGALGSTQVFELQLRAARDLPRNTHFSVFENAEIHRIRLSAVMNWNVIVIWRQINAD